MGSNRFENFIFSLLMCVCMVVGMTLYNHILKQGFTVEAFGALASVKFLLIFALAFVIDWFVVGLTVKAIVKRLLPENASFVKKVVTISLLMILFMCVIMSAFATLFQFGASHFFAHYGRVFVLNLVFALPLNFLIVSPLVRAVFFRIFAPVKNPPITPNAA